MFNQNLYLNTVNHEYFAFIDYTAYESPELLPSLDLNIIKPHTLTYSLPVHNTTDIKFTYRNSLFLSTPKYQKCTSLILYLFLLGSTTSLLQKLSSNFHRPCHAVYQQTCNSLCNPTLNWHYFIIINNYLPPTQSNPTNSILKIPRNTFIRNAVKIDFSTNTTSILIRFTWLPFSDSLFTHTSQKFQNFTLIQSFSNTKKLNLEQAEVPVVTSFPVPQQKYYEKVRPLHILRKETDSNPGKIFLYRNVEHVNGTITEMALYQLGRQDIVAVIAETPNSITGPFGLNAERWLQLDYSTPVKMPKLIFLTGLPTPVGYSFSFLFQPLTFWIWVNMLSSLILLTITIKLLFPTDLKTTEVAFAILLPLLDQSMSNKFWRIHSNHSYLFITRFIIITWLLSCLLLSNLYRSYIAGYLIQPSLQFPPKTYSELALSKYSLSFHIFNPKNVNQAIFSTINEYAKSNQSSRHLPLPISEVNCQ